MLLSVASCRLPFVPTRRDKVASPEAVLRFQRAAESLARAPAPSLAEVTRALAVAVESLRGAVPKGPELRHRLEAQADQLALAPPERQAELARPALDLALETTRATRPPVPARERDQAQAPLRASLERARAAVAQVTPGAPPETVAAAYRALAEAMLRSSGGPPGAASGDELAAQIARAAVEDPELARRAGAQAVTALCEALLRLPSLPPSSRELGRKAHARAAALLDAPLLEYAGQLQGALALVADALAAVPLPTPAARLLEGARRAVAALRDDRPFELQRAAAQDALRALADVLTVAGAR